MASAVAARRLRILLAVIATLPLAACTGQPGGAPASPTPVAAGWWPSADPTPTASPDPFAGLPYRLDLPPDWITRGSSAYNTTLDSTPDMRAWLAGLGLEGPNAFRAYEPATGGEGLRLAVNPQRTWNPSPLQEEGSVAALPGVSGKVSSDVVATGAGWKAFGYRWTESMDWGSGTPTPRDCVGYFVMVDPNPTNVVLCYPAGSSRAGDAQTIATTFRMTGTPVFTPPPGTAPTPSPTPYDKYASPAPSAASHVAPDLEALLPDTIDGKKVDKESWTGVESMMAADSPILVALGKRPEDYASARGLAGLGGPGPFIAFGVKRVAGVTGADLLKADFAIMSDAKLTPTTIAGHHVTRVEYGMMPYWVYATGDVVYELGMTDEATAAEFFAALP